MRNLFQQFADIFPDPPLQVGTVTATDGAVATVTLPGGGVLRARGDAPEGQRVFVRNGVIEGDAPNLAFVSVEV